MRLGRQLMAVSALAVTLVLTRASGATGSVARVADATSPASGVATRSSDATPPLAGAGLVGGSETSVTAEATATGRYVVGDFHTHTFLSDGGYSLAAVASRALRTYRLGWMANSDHGGKTRRDASGRVLPAYVWRWVSLKRHSFPAVRRVRSAHAGKRVIQGIEWNVPGSDHACVGIVADEPTAISDFEYRFDHLDHDTSRVGVPKDKASHNDAIQAVQWLRANYGDSSYVVMNHPSWRLYTTVAEVRDLNSAAPDVVIGFEGVPGSQKSSTRGNYGLTTDTRARTYGGADYWLARVGGPWDALLGEGRRFWVFGNSDFHTPGRGFWPGQYTRTYTYIRGDSAHDIIAGMRSGYGFVAYGGIIDNLSLRARSDETSSVAMGQTLVLQRGQDATITVRFRIPRSSNDGPRPRVDHVDLISGDIHEPAARGTPAYTSATNPTTRIVARFRGSKPWYGWSANGTWAQRTYTLKNVDHDMYVRLRGTNLAPGVAKETDAAGNPLRDSMKGVNTRDKAWADAWFYSNPIFIDVR